MNENKIYKKSVPIFIVGALLFLITSILLKDGSYLGGFILGYIVGVVAFTIIIKFVNTILVLRSHSVFIIALMGILKAGIYAFGFFLAIKMPNIFHLLSVFFGCLSIKITIYFESYRNR